MMTVFFYSGITSYPRVSTEEKTIGQINFKLCVKSNRRIAIRGCEWYVYT